MAAPSGAPSSAAGSDRRPGPWRPRHARPAPPPPHQPSEPPGRRTAPTSRQRSPYHRVDTRTWPTSRRGDMAGAPPDPVTAAETHSYEPDDAFTRHLDPVFVDRAVHVVRDGDGPGRPYVGGQPLYYLSSTPADRMGRP